MKFFNIMTLALVLALSTGGFFINKKNDSNEISLKEKGLVYENNLEVLEIAMILGERYNGMGSKYDSTKFLVEVIESTLSDNYYIDFQKAIDFRSFYDFEIKKTVEEEQIEKKGIVKALIDAEIGEEITDMTKVKPGDLIQFCEQDEKSKKWNGYTGIIYEIVKPEIIKFYSFHKSLYKVGDDRFGVSTYKVKIADKKKVYVVRIK